MCSTPTPRLLFRSTLQLPLGVYPSICLRISFLYALNSLKSYASSFGKKTIKSQTARGLSRNCMRLYLTISLRIRRKNDVRSEVGRA